MRRTRRFRRPLRRHKHLTAKHAKDAIHVVCQSPAFLLRLFLRVTLALLASLLVVHHKALWLEAVKSRLLVGGRERRLVCIDLGADLLLQDVAQRCDVVAVVAHRHIVRF